MTQTHDPDSMANLTGTYVKVLVIEVVIVALLWLFGRLFS